MARQLRLLHSKAAIGIVVQENGNDDSRKGAKVADCRQEPQRRYQRHVVIHIFLCVFAPLRDNLSRWLTLGAGKGRAKKSAVRIPEE